jgi:imidazolonepropionase-like amidohydrolase
MHAMDGLRAAVLALAVAGSLWASGESEAQGRTFAVRDVRVFDGRRVLEHRTVVVRDGRIASVRAVRAPIPGGVEVIDGRGRTLLPGLIDAHVHVSTQGVEASLSQALRLGVTTVLDMGAMREGAAAMVAIAAADSDGLADVRTASYPATAPGGHPTQMSPGIAYPTISPPDEAQAFVDTRIAEGASYIKIILEDCSEFSGFAPCPTIDDATLTALIAAAHRRGKLAIVHAEEESRARQAIEAGADGLAHLFVGERAGSDFGALARAHNVFVTPTLSVLYQWCGRHRGAAIAADPRLTSQIVEPGFRHTMAGWPQPAVASCEATHEALRQLDEAGVPILVGSDAPTPGAPYGAATLDEIALLVEAGLTPSEALRAATSTPARIFGLSDRGEIRRGWRADLLLVEGDPTQNIEALRDIVAVWKRGERVERVAAPERPAGE